MPSAAAQAAEKLTARPAAEPAATLAAQPAAKPAAPPGQHGEVARLPHETDAPRGGGLPKPNVL